MATLLGTVSLPIVGLLSDGANAQEEREQSVIVRGNQRIEVETILSYMQLRPNQTVTAEDLNSAVRRLFDTGLFSDVEIVPEQNALIVVVVENPSINEIAFEGNSALSDEDLAQIISLRSRLPLTRSAAEADAQAIIEIYRRTGRYGASVEPVVIERSENRVDLVFEIDEGELTGVSSIDFVGNNIYSDSRLRGVIETSESGFLAQFFSSDVYDPDRLELDKELLRQYYLERGYADFSVLSATAELTPDKESFFLTFTVEEGEQYTFGTFDIELDTRGLEIEEFEQLLPYDLEGDTYDATRVEEIADELGDLAAERGFAFVQVRPRADKNSVDRIINVTFEMVEGEKIYIERIEIEGNTQTLDRVIRREIELIEGDAFDARKIRNARNDIRALGYFSSVEIDPIQGSADDRAVLKVKVTEQSTGALSFGLGFSSSVGPIGNVSITERNFLGRGQILSANVTAAGDTQIYDFAFTEPKFLDRDLAVGFRTYFIQDDRTDESSFSQNTLGASPFVGFPLGPNTDLVARYSIVRDDIEVDPDTSAIILADEGSSLTSSVGYTITYDQRNDPLEPTAGYLVTGDQQFAGLGGSVRFIKSSGSIKGWQGLFGDEVIASLELEGGALFAFGDPSQINNRFFLGGESFRGFAVDGLGPRDLERGTDDALGGNYFAVLRGEVSFPLGLPEELGIYGGVFVDAGTLWGLDTDVIFDANGQPITDVQSQDFVPRVSAGGLLFVETPFGPLELSLGFPIIDEDFDDDELFRISIGTRF
ncbi:outer membrane protein assembly factor BamA [Rhodobacteraceae bacterium NNCM2]|nr:outer membrane protein assembly factor BamA [Coraliihabitans acroporae]